MNTLRSQEKKQNDALLTRRRYHEENSSSISFDQRLNQTSEEVQTLQSNYRNMYSFDWEDNFIRESQKISKFLSYQALWNAYNNMYFPPPHQMQQIIDDFENIIPSKNNEELMVKKNSLKKTKVQFLNELRDYQNRFIGKGESKSLSAIIESMEKELARVKAENRNKFKHACELYYQSEENKINLELDQLKEKNKNYNKNEELAPPTQNLKNFIITDEIYKNNKDVIDTLIDDYSGYNSENDIYLNLKLIEYYRNKMELENAEKKKTQPVFEIQRVISKIKDTDDFVCFICNNGDEFPQLIYECDKCHITVHQGCYGIKTDNVEGWICDLCKAKNTKEESYEQECLLCPVKGGAMKQVSLKNDCNFLKELKTYKERIANNSMQVEDLPKFNDCIIIRHKDFQDNKQNMPWVHLSCALWNNNIEFGNFEEKTDIKNIDTLSYPSFFEKCDICHLKGEGPVIKCNNINCFFQCHVECARINRYCLEVDIVDGSYIYNVYCYDHQPVHYLQQLKRKKKENEKEIKKFSDHMAKLYKNYEKEYKKTLFTKKAPKVEIVPKKEVTLSKEEITFALNSEKVGNLRESKKLIRRGIRRLAESNSKSKHKSKEKSKSKSKREKTRSRDKKIKKPSKKSINKNSAKKSKNKDNEHSPSTASNSNLSNVKSANIKEENIKKNLKISNNNAQSETNSNNQKTFDITIQNLDEKGLMSFSSDYNSIFIDKSKLIPEEPKKPRDIIQEAIDDEFVNNFHTYLANVVKDKQSNSIIFFKNKKEVEKNNEKTMEVYGYTVSGEEFFENLNIPYVQLMMKSNEDLWENFKYADWTLQQKKEYYQKLVSDPKIYDLVIHSNSLVIVKNTDGSLERTYFEHDKSTKYCTCKQPFSEGEQMVQCEKACECLGSPDGWFHVKCINDLAGKTQEEINNLKFICRFCQNHESK